MFFLFLLDFERDLYLKILRVIVLMKVILKGLLKSVFLVKFWSVFWKLLCDFRMSVVYLIYDLRVFFMLIVYEELSKGKW